MATSTKSKRSFTNIYNKIKQALFKRSVLDSLISQLCSNSLNSKSVGEKFATTMTYGFQ